MPYRGVKLQLNKISGARSAAFRRQVHYVMISRRFHLPPDACASLTPDNLFSCRCSSPPLPLSQRRDVRDVMPSVPGVQAQHLCKSKYPAVLRMPEGAAEVGGVH